MSRTQTIKIVNPDKKEIWAPCATCGKNTAHMALTQVNLFDESDDGYFQWSSENYTLMCGGCKTVSFCVESSNSEDMEYNKDGDPIHTVTQKVYPGRVAGRPLLEDVQLLPYGIATVYKQTHEAICGKQTILAGIGLRAIVDAVCQEKNAEGADLSQKINDLVAKGITTQSGADILHSIRLIGNESAHQAKANSESELLTALEVVEHLLLGVYLIPQKAASLKKIPKFKT